MIGRFISEDPTGLAAGPNEYTYVGDDPLDFRDPFGLDKKPSPEPCYGGFAQPDGSCLLPNQPQKKDCSQILKGAALTVGLDAAGTALGAIPGGGAGLVTAQVAVGLAGAANAAYHRDLGGTFAGIGGAQVSAVAAGADYVGWTAAARALPAIGSAVSAYYLYKDATRAIDQYHACEAENGG